MRVDRRRDIIRELSQQRGMAYTPSRRPPTIPEPAIRGYRIKAGSITATQIAVGTITAANIEAGTITAVELAANSISTEKLQAEAVTAAKIKAEGIEAGQIKAGAITTGKLAAEAVEASKIKAGTITATQIAASTITGGNIAAGTIEAGNIKAGTITATQIGANAITTEKLNAEAVTAGKIASGTITSAQIASGTITGGNIAAGTITTAKLAASAIDGMTITGAIIRTAATGKRVVIDGEGLRAYNATEPVLNFDIASGNLTIKGKVSEGSEVPAGSITGTIGNSQIGENAVTSSKIAAETIVAGDIAAGTITGAKIAAETITGGNIAAGTITAGKIAATAIDAMTITGATFRTGAAFPNAIFDSTGLALPEHIEGSETLSQIEWKEALGGIRQIIQGSFHTGLHHLTLATIGGEGTNAELSLNAGGSVGGIEVAAGEERRSLLNAEGKSRFLQLSSTRKERDFGVVTALPAEAAVGDRCKYKAAAGIYWDLVYTGEATYPWAKVGGPPLYDEIATQQSTKSTTYTGLATAGPSVTLPLKGDYDVTTGAQMFNNTANNHARMSYKIGAAAASTADEMDKNEPTAGAFSLAHAVRTRRKTGLAAATVLLAQYMCTPGGEAFFVARYMVADPVRVG